VNEVWLDTNVVLRFLLATKNLAAETTSKGFCQMVSESRWKLFCFECRVRLDLRPVIRHQKKVIS